MMVPVALLDARVPFVLWPPRGSVRCDARRPQGGYSDHRHRERNREDERRSAAAKEREESDSRARARGWRCRHP